MFCTKCGKKIEDNSLFCPNCGSKLIESDNNLNKQKDIYEIKEHYSDSKNGSKGLLVVLLVLVAVLLVGVAIAVFVIIKPFGANKKEKINNKKVSTTSSPKVDDTDYEGYYEKVSDIFGKLIVSDENSGKIDSYKESLKDAIENKSADNCKYNYDKLKELEESLTEKSKEEIKTLKDELKQWEKKKTSKSAKKKTEYKKNKSLAKDEISVGNYSKAKTYYKACIDALKKAKAKKKKAKAKSNSSSNNTASTNDDWYKTGASDDTTIDEVYYNYLDSTTVSYMSQEEKRYYINTLFAAYGYRFSNQTIQSFFDNQSWYYADYNISVGDQNSIIRKFDDMCKYNYDLLKG